ncbi:MAG: ABC transporter permease subunit [Thermoplasmatota archaeon]
MMRAMVTKEILEAMGTGGGQRVQFIVALALNVVIGFATPLFIGSILTRSAVDPSLDTIYAAWIAAGASLGIATFTAMFYPITVGADLIAGERERHTLETLLAGPVPSSQILLSKLLGMVTLGLAGSVMIAIAAMLGMLVGFGLDPGWIGFLLPPAALVTTALPVFMFSCVAVLASMRAKTARAAQQTMAYVMLPLLLLPAGFTLVDVENTAVLLVVGILMGAVMLVAAIAAPLAAFALFKRERLMAVG